MCMNELICVHKHTRTHKQTHTHTHSHTQNTYTNIMYTCVHICSCVNNMENCSFYFPMDYVEKTHSCKGAALSSFPSACILTYNKHQHKQISVIKKSYKLVIFLDKLSLINYNNPRTNMVVVRSTCN